MKANVVILRSAEADLRELRSYVLKNFGQQTWQHSYGSIRKALDRLAAYPSAGTVPDELSLVAIDQYRQVISGMNRIVYEIRGDTAYVHLISDTRQDLKNVLLRRMLREG